MGGDSSCCIGWDQYPISNPKVVSNGELLIGISWSLRTGQIVQTLNFPRVEEGEDPYLYTVKKFVPALITALKDLGRESDKGTFTGFTFLLGIRGRVFLIDNEFAALETTRRFTAVGCGDSFAMGALKAMEEMNLTPESRLLKALEISAALSAGVAGPFTIISSKD